MSDGVSKYRKSMGLEDNQDIFNSGAGKITKATFYGSGEDYDCFVSFKDYFTGAYELEIREVRLLRDYLTEMLTKYESGDIIQENPKD